MGYKLFITILLLLMSAPGADAQRIVVDTASTNKYLAKPKEKKETQVQAMEEPTFSDRALSIGMGILNRLKARLNLEEATESIKDKRDRILGKPGEKNKEEG